MTQLLAGKHALVVAARRQEQGELVYDYLAGGS